MAKFGKNAFFGLLPRREYVAFTLLSERRPEYQLFTVNLVGQENDNRIIVSMVQRDGDSVGFFATRWRCDPDIVDDRGRLITTVASLRDEGAPFMSAITSTDFGCSPASPDIETSSPFASIAPPYGMNSPCRVSICSAKGSTEFIRASQSALGSLTACPPMSPGLHSAIRLIEPVGDRTASQENLGHMHSK
jgi:hypothetical protein